MDAGEIAYLRKVMKDATRASEWRPISGGIVVPVVGEFDPRGRRRDPIIGPFSEEEYYGGDLIAESMNARDAIAAAAAIVALPSALAEIERLRGAGRLQLTRFADTPFGRAS